MEAVRRLGDGPEPAPVDKLTAFLAERAALAAPAAGDEPATPDP
jgi:hypothetical protein